LPGQETDNAASNSFRRFLNHRIFARISMH
jgi:hypothetical protein